MNLKIVLNENQWKRISDLSGSAGLLVTGSTVIPFLMNPLEPIKVLFGLVISSCLWYLSIQTAGKY